MTTAIKKILGGLKNPIKQNGIKKFTILHSNDMHGDFLAEVQGEKGELMGG